MVDVRFKCGMKEEQWRAAGGMWMTGMQRNLRESSVDVKEMQKVIVLGVTIAVPPVAKKSP